MSAAREPWRTEPEPRATLSTDAAIVLKVIDDAALTFDSIAGTLRRRDKRWSPEHVRAMLNEAIRAGCVDSGGTPIHYRRARTRVEPVARGT